MKITPMTDEQIAAEKAKFGPWPRGAYDFEVAAAEDAISKAGNEMIVLELQVFDRNGNRRNMKDWLVDSVPVKLKNVCDAVGLHTAYANGDVASYDFVGRTGKLMLTIERREGYDDRNKVAGYVPADHAAAPTARQAPTAARKSAGGGGGQDLDDSIPFAAPWQ